MKIYQALADIMKDVDAIGKNKTNPQQGYKFRGIDDMYNALHSYFKKHEVFICSNVLSSKREERQTKSGGTLIYTITTCEFSFYATDGSFVKSTIEGEAMDSGDKSTNKAMSTALKYALMQMFLIPTEEQLDTEYKTYEVSPKAKKVKEEVNEIDLLCRKTYTNAEDLILVIESCEKVAQLNNLYGCNPELVSDTNIREQFTKRKNEITKA